MKRFSISTALAALSTVALAFACTGSTPGRIVPLELVLEPRATEASFTTSAGWEVSLDEAVVAVGPLYVSAADAEMARVLSPLAVARAHGGVDPLTGHRVRAEWIGQVAFDALGTAPVVLGEVEAEAGLARGVTIGLDPPGAAIADALRDHHAWVSGTARRGEEVVAFEGGLDIADEPLLRRVDGVPLDDYLDAGRVVLGTHPARWLDGAHFDRLADPGDGSPRAIGPDTQPRNAWYLGLRSTRAWEARFDGEDGGVL